MGVCPILGRKSSRHGGSVDKAAGRSWEAKGWDIQVQFIIVSGRISYIAKQNISPRYKHEHSVVSKQADLRRVDQENLEAQLVDLKKIVSRLTKDKSELLSIAQCVHWAVR